MKSLVSQMKTEYSLITLLTSAVIHEGGLQSVLLMMISGDILGVKEKYNKTKLNEYRGFFGGIIEVGKLLAEN